MAAPGQAGVTAGPVGKKIEHPRLASNHAMSGFTTPDLQKKNTVRLLSFTFVSGEGETPTIKYERDTAQGLPGQRRLSCGTKRGVRLGLFNNGNN